MKEDVIECRRSKGGVASEASEQEGLGRYERGVCPSRRFSLAIEPA